MRLINNIHVAVRTLWNGVCARQGRSLRDIDEVRSQLSSFPSGTRLWEPSDGQSREDWLRCHGQPDDVCRRTREKLAALKKLITDDMPHGADQPPSLHPTPVSAASTTHSVIIAILHHKRKRYRCHSPVRWYDRKPRVHLPVLGLESINGIG